MFKQLVQASLKPQSHTHCLLLLLLILYNYTSLPRRKSWPLNYALNKVAYIRKAQYLAVLYKDLTASRQGKALYLVDQLSSSAGSVSLKDRVEVNLILFSGS